MNGKRNKWGRKERERKEIQGTKIEEKRTKRSKGWCHIWAKVDF